MNPADAERIKARARQVAQDAPLPSPEIARILNHLLLGSPSERGGERACRAN